MDKQKIIVTLIILIVVATFTKATITGNPAYHPLPPCMDSDGGIKPE